jgi:hypothetical protein
MDPDTQKNIPGIFVAGWSRLASYGLVGISGKDGSRGAQALHEYMDENRKDSPDWKELELQILKSKNTIVDKKKVKQLFSVEAEIAAKNHLAEYKFATNQEMLTAIDLV